MLNKFGSTLETFGLKELDDPRVAIAVHNLVVAQMPPDSDGDGISDINELTRGDSPSIYGADGVGQFCPDIRYACGARIASAPPATDRLGLFSAGLVVLGLMLSRRSHRRTRPER